MQRASQSPSAPANIFDWTISELRSAQGKITYIGEQTRPILTVVFSTGDSSFPSSLDHFTKFQSSARGYSNDRLSSVMRFEVLPEEFQRILSALRPVLAAGRSVGKPILSFTVLLRIRSEFEGREFLMDYDLGQAFYHALMSAFDGKKGIPAPLATQFRQIYPSLRTPL